MEVAAFRGHQATLFGCGRGQQTGLTPTDLPQLLDGAETVQLAE